MNQKKSVSAKSYNPDARLALFGLILAQGAPIGYFIHSFFFHPYSPEFFHHIEQVLTDSHSPLFYMWCGTSLFFSAFGYYTGRLLKTIHEQHEKISTSFSLIRNFDDRKKKLFLGISDDLQLPVVNAMEYLDSFSKGHFGPVTSEQKNLSESVYKDLVNFNERLSDLIHYKSYDENTAPNVRQIINEIVNEFKNTELVLLVDIDTDVSIQVESQLFSKAVHQILHTIAANSEATQIKISGTKRPLLNHGENEFYYFVLQADSRWKSGANFDWIPAQNILEWQGGIMWHDPEHHKVQVYMAVPLHRKGLKVAS